MIILYMKGQVLFLQKPRMDKHRPSQPLFAFIAVIILGGREPAIS